MALYQNWYSKNIDNRRRPWYYKDIKNKGASPKALKMRRDVDKEIKANNIEKATEKFCNILRDNGYEWAADEMTETVSNGYFCCSNAAEHNLKKGEVTSPKTSDWSYYWAIEQLDEKLYYAWFIERQ